jgi:HTH-type transcriptional regulator, quorum sensing regulator NprR
MQIGSLIKFHRTKLGLTQNELAAGICSIPHLSKIENNSKEANGETLKLLLGKLQIEMQDVVESEQQISNLLYQLLKNITYVEIDEAKQTMQKLKEMEELITFTDQIYLYELYKMRYFISINELNIADEQYNWLYSNKRNFSQHEKYLLLYLRGLLFLTRGRYEEADNTFTELMNTKLEFGLLQGELYYHLSILKSRQDEINLALLYGRKALELFKDQYNFKRITYTLMSLALNYSNGNAFDEALEMYEHAIRNVKVLNETKYLPQIYHNIGMVYFLSKEYVNSIEYLNKSINMIDCADSHYYISIFNLALCHYEIGMVEESKRLFIKLINETSKTSIFNSLGQAYIYFLQGDKTNGILLLEDKIVPVLIKDNQYSILFGYLKEVLREYYLDTKKYEKALIYAL